MLLAKMDTHPGVLLKVWRPRLTATASLGTWLESIPVSPSPHEAEGRGAGVGQVICGLTRHLVLPMFQIKLKMGCLKAGPSALTLQTQDQQLGLPEN